MQLLPEVFTNGSALLLIASVAVVGVLHTIVPDHWVPIALIARERKWTRAQTARAAFTAGTGHVVTTLILGGIVWIAGVAVATQFGHIVDLISSVALMAFGVWIGISSWYEMRADDHGHSHDHEHDHDHQHTHAHAKSKNNRTALLLILGSSPMIEGIPAFFAAGKYGIGVITIMAIVFAAATIATYVLLCVYSSATLANVKLGAFEKYGEVFSGAFIALVGVVFFIWPVI